MTAEKFYKNQGYSILDKFDKKAKKFDYYDLIDFADSFSKKKLSFFISNIDNKLYNKIRNSKGDAECRRFLREHLHK